MSGQSMGSRLDLLIDVAPRGGRRRAVEDGLRAAIRDGRLVAGVRLPSTRDLAAELGLSRGTVSQAYEQLTAEGWLVARTKAGTRVADGAAASVVPVAAPDPVAVPVPRHDLSPGRPDVSSFPRVEWARAVRHAVHEAPAEAFGYGDPRGRPELRSALAGYLGRVRGVRVDPSHLVVCSGYTQGLGLLAGVLAELGVRTAGMENPAVGDHVSIVRPRMAVADVAVDAQGLCVGDLERSGAGAAVCTPAHQFPLGVGMSPGRRAELLAWAGGRGAWVVEDDYDGEFRYDRRPVGALQPRLPHQVAYLGTTSKSLGPAVRLGWIACPPALLEPLVEAKRLADRQTGPMDQLALAHLIGSGAYDSHLRTMRHVYRRRRDDLVAAVGTALPRARVTGIAAGLHAMVELPPGPSEAHITAALQAASIRVQTLGDYTRGEREAGATSLIVGYATPAPHAYAGAVEALVRTVRGVLGRAA
ncbi:PLP-dependent aminotransferase family protein [Streptomyces sp. NBC_00859]|uniref:MocR-like pyridoxine biosynthesis transcription factor PdxR n=1 Tax=Streptomyces sp. NBC_00859 TaxID=2903682 RepID=UPI003869E35F|nr:PLP-dependent aminotransferase family protein [Streptomyces sp. NBC_00859]